MTYIRFAALVAFMALGLVALWYRGQAAHAVAERDAARADLAIAVDANRAQQATIGRLRAEAEANDRLLAALADDVEAIRKGQEQTTQAIGDLKDANEDVRAYLGGAVPADLERLLNR